MLSVNTNTAAMNAYLNLSKSNDAQTKSMQRLSSGYRINSAADDAAGLAISTGMGSQISGMTQAVRNTQDGISVVQTASGALTEATSILQRMRDLAVQAANDSNDAASRANITTEATQLATELTRISSSTVFNGKPLLDGTSASMNFQVGANSGDTINVGLTNLATIASSVQVGTGSTSGTAAFAVATPTAVSGTLSFTSTKGSTTATAAVVVSAASGAFTTVQQVADKLNQDSAFSSTFVASVDKNNKLSVTSLDGGVVTLTSPGGGVAAGAYATGGVSFDSNANAQAAITTLNTAIGNVSTAQASLGAYQNRFEHTINNLNTAINNTTASQSRIRDTDMAQEMTNFSKSQILVQAGTAMLAQANSSSQSILKLLQG